MDPRLLRYYNQELQHLREMGQEFAEEFPKIAGRLGMEGIEVADPYVERLLEGSAFLAARVQLKLDAEFPRFTQHLLEMLYPHYLAPTPSMAVAQILPTLSESNLANGLTVPRGSLMRAGSVHKDGAACTFTTAQDVSLWPVELVEARYFPAAADLPLARAGLTRRVKGGVKLRLRASAGLRFDQLPLDRLRVFLGGTDDVAYRLIESIGAQPVGALVCGTDRPLSNFGVLQPEQIELAGFRDDEALLPLTQRNFGGYRLLQEYFSFPQRYLFFDLSGLRPALARVARSEIEIHLLFSRSDPQLESLVSAANFLLHCTPVINLFPKRADRIQVSDTDFEFHVVADRTRPMDFEIYDITELTGFGTGADSEQRFRSFYETHHGWDHSPHGYFTVRREPRLLSEKQRRVGTRTRYIGSEVFLALVDPNEAPYRPDLRQLSLVTRCTNRDLPILLNLGGQASDFALDISAPVDGIRCVKGPTKPYSAIADGAPAWKFISQLSLNYLSLLDTDPSQGAAALRELLDLYATTSDSGLRRQVEGVRSIRAEPVVTRLPMPGPLCFGRGIGITVEVDELAFEGGSAFLLGAVFEHFFARHVTLNSFTETTLRSLTRGEIMHWGARCGLRPIL